MPLLRERAGIVNEIRYIELLITINKDNIDKLHNMWREFIKNSPNSETLPPLLENYFLATGCRVNKNKNDIHLLYSHIRSTAGGK